MHRYRFVLCLLAGAACAGEPAPRSPQTDTAWEVLDAPAAPGSAQPRLVTSENGQVFLSWIEPLGDAGHALRFAAFEDGHWTSPQTIAEGTDWFVNWADFPTLVAWGDSALAAHYLVRHPADPHAYDIHVVRSTDGGQRWSAPVVPHRDGVAAEHGFVSMVPEPDGRLRIVWLDGRAYASRQPGTPPQTALRTATVDPDGGLHDEVILDDRTCDCCPTAAVRTTRGALVAYRDRSADEIRDIALVQHQDERWTSMPPAPADGWRIEGCPVNGPVLDARDGRLVLAWFSAAADTPRVQVSFATDDGGSWSTPLPVHTAIPLGRPDVVLLDDGAALVSWIETANEGAALRVRRVAPGAALGPPITLAEVPASRQAGMPQLARSRDAVLTAWTEPGRGIRTARRSLSP